jgi:hypothetical protein
MIANNKNIKIRYATNKEQADVCLEAVFYYLGSDKEEECFYDVPHPELGRCGVYVYETKTLIVARYQGQYE